MGNNQSMSETDKKVLVGVSIGAAVALSIVTLGTATPIAAKGAETVINLVSSQGGSDSGSSNSNMHMGSGSMSSSSTGVSKTSSSI